jgi:hypothetical protein
MNDTDRFSVVEFYHLPGFMQEESARLISPKAGMPKSFCQGIVAAETKLNKVTGCSSEYRYEILPLSEVFQKIAMTNGLKKRIIAEFRHKVYGEPIPVGCQLRD